MSGMFANVLDQHGNPFCPMNGCFEVVEPGMGVAGTFAPDALLAAKEAGLVGDGDFVIIHTECPVEHDWPLSIRIGMLRAGTSDFVPVAPVVRESPVSPVRPEKSPIDILWDEAARLYPDGVEAREEYFNRVRRERGISWE